MDGSFNFSKLPYEIKFTLYNVDGSIKYSLRQMITEKDKPARLQNIRYDLDKQEIYADSNLFYMATIWNQKTDWRYSSYAKTKHVKLPLSDNKKMVKVGDKVTLYSTVPYTSGIGQEVVIKQNKKLKTPTVKEVTTKSRYVEGTTYPSSKVLVKSGKKNYQGQSDSKGKYKIKILSLSAGSEVAVSAVDRLNQSTPVVKVKVLRVFTKFTTSKIKSGGTALKGTGYIGSEVKAYKSSKLIAKGTIDKKGNYTLKVSKLKKMTHCF
ncbi:Ig-like domain-containing protein [Exiguobacterium artemiae]